MYSFISKIAKRLVLVGRCRTKYLLSYFIISSHANSIKNSVHIFLNYFILAAIFYALKKLHIKVLLYYLVHRALKCAEKYNLVKRNLMILVFEELIISVALNSNITNLEPF